MMVKINGKNDITIRTIKEEKEWPYSKAITNIFTQKKSIEEIVLFNFFHDFYRSYRYIVLTVDLHHHVLPMFPLAQSVTYVGW
jgi:hypothetical protein